MTPNSNFRTGSLGGLDNAVMANEKYGLDYMNGDPNDASQLDLPNDRSQLYPNDESQLDFPNDRSQLEFTVNYNDHSRLYEDADELPQPTRTESPPMTPSKSRSIANESGLLGSQPIADSFTSKYNIPDDLRISNMSDDQQDMDPPAENDAESIKNMNNDDASPCIQMTEATSFSASNVAETSRFGGLRARENSATTTQTSGRKTATASDEE